MQKKHKGILSLAPVWVPIRYTLNFLNKSTSQLTFYCEKRKINLKQL